MTSEATVVQETDVPPERWTDPVRGEVAFRTLLGDAGSATDSLTAGVAELGPGGWLGHHRHEPAEVYYVLEGEGTVLLGERERPVTAGTAVFIPGDLEHGIRNTGPGRLRFFYVLAADAFTDVEYLFTGG